MARLLAHGQSISKKEASPVPNVTASQDLYVAAFPRWDPTSTGPDETINSECNDSHDIYDDKTYVPLNEPSRPSQEWQIIDEDTRDEELGKADSHTSSIGTSRSLSTVKSSIKDFAMGSISGSSKGEFITRPSVLF